MAEVHSLGTHRPAALDYMVAEGFLPKNPSQDLYNWETYVAQDSGDDVDEELLTTNKAVAWSRGRFVRNVFRFDLEGENITQALLTTFATSHGTKIGGDSSLAETDKSCTRDDDQPVFAAPTHTKDVQPQPSLVRALVVLLQTKAHIYYLTGASFIVSLPFAVERAYPAPRGIVLLRKSVTISTVAGSLQNLVAPPNSFLSSQASFVPSSIQSLKTTNALDGQNQPVFTQATLDNDNFDRLIRSPVHWPQANEDEDVARLYSLTDPLAEIGVVSLGIHQPKPRLSAGFSKRNEMSFEPIDSSERLVYISAKDELADCNRGEHGELLLLVTINHVRGVLSLWHGWYIGEKSLRSLYKRRNDVQASNASRRTSFLSANVVSTIATPGARHRDGARESIAATGTVRPSGEHPPQHNTRSSSKKPTKQEEEDVMASQMDPDFLPLTSHQGGRDNRRISSMNTDIRSNLGTGGTGVGTRRATSMGGPNDRLSFRKSRGSTPGKLQGRSMDLDDSMMSIDSESEQDEDEDLDAILQHILASVETSIANSLFWSANDGLKSELVVRKFHSLPIMSVVAAAPEKASESFNVIPFTDAISMRVDEDDRLDLHIHNRITTNLTILRLLVRQCSLSPDSTPSQLVAVPSVLEEIKMGKHLNVVKLRDQDIKAVFLRGSGIIFSIDQPLVYHPPENSSYRVHGAYDIDFRCGHDNEAVGKNRVVASDGNYSTLLRPGADGCYDEVGSDNVHHRRSMRLRPKDESIYMILKICQVAIPRRHAQKVLPIWCASFALLNNNRMRLGVSADEIEWVALTTTVFIFVLHLMDSKSRAGVRMMRLASSKKRTSARSLPRSRPGLELSCDRSWLWLQRKPLSARQSTTAPHANFQNTLLTTAIAAADELVDDNSSLHLPRGEPALSFAEITRLLYALHLAREEQKLTMTTELQQHCDLAAIITQIGAWMGAEDWDYTPGHYYHKEGASEDTWIFIKSTLQPSLELRFQPRPPVGFYSWFEQALDSTLLDGYPICTQLLNDLQEDSPTRGHREIIENLTPRMTALCRVLKQSNGLKIAAEQIVESMVQHGISTNMLVTLPPGIAAPLREAVTRCRTRPPAKWSAEILRLIGREDLTVTTHDDTTSGVKPHVISRSLRDVQSLCLALEQPIVNARTREASRHAVSQLIFSQDRRLVEVVGMMHFNSPQIAECVKQPDWTDAMHFEQQRRVMTFATTRMIALPVGDAMIHFDSQTPLLTEKYNLPGFSSSCLMQPMGHTLTADRTGLTEEKVNWAYFNAGASMGLRISHSIKGIDTSWIAFNKPAELTNRHAGLLLALGLNGHLKSLAKWLAFKHLTPKHMMTSVGLLLGLSASYMGTMDNLITRMLSVHITRMLPQGAAELNVSPLTQTAGLMGIGLLYYNTQHRRMSEIMLSEIENKEVEDPDSGPDPLRNESYRLAAGLALGFINLGRGDDLHGLHGMGLVERLLSVAVGPRPINCVHIFDRATAGAIVAIALVYMKSDNRAIAKKIEIPKTEAQFEHVRPDMLLLRVMAKHVILWNEIDVDKSNEGSTHGTQWINDNLPECYHGRLSKMTEVHGRYRLSSKDVPFLNVLTGLAWVLSLRYAGSGNLAARDEILTVLSCFVGVAADSYYYDAKVTRSSLRRCIDILITSVATIMAGTGDLQTLRHLRRLHGRTDADTPYGSHLAVHMAIGTLFLGGGLYSFGTSNLAIASLICAFYPLYPMDVHDNQAHLQALRHFWVLAAEARCIKVQDVDGDRPVPIPILVRLKDNGSIKPREPIQLTAPCLLPDLGTIASIETDDPTYWKVKLDFITNPHHLDSFRRNQRVLVRRRLASEASDSPFTSALSVRRLEQSPQQQYSSVMDNNHSSLSGRLLLRSISNIPVFNSIEQDITELALSSEDPQGSASNVQRSTAVDDRLPLQKFARSNNRDELYNLRLLFAWADSLHKANTQMSWIGEEAVAELRSLIERRARSVPS